MIDTKEIHDNIYVITEMMNPGEMDSTGAIGDCYSAALRALRDFPGAVLCHGRQAAKNN